MSTYYKIYTEAFMNNDWELIDPYIKKQNDYILIPAYECFSGSYFSEAFDKMNEMQSFKKIALDDVSRDIKALFDKDNGRYQHLEMQFYTIRYDDLKKYIYFNGKENYTWHGYVLKDSLNNYITNETENLYPVIVDEFKNIPYKVIKKFYTYHEWDNIDDWLYHFKKLNKNIEHRLENFKNEDYIDAAQVRSVIYIC